MIEVLQPFNALIDSMLLNKCVYYLFCTPTIGLDMLGTYTTAGLGVLEPLYDVKQIHVDIWLP